MGPHPNENQMVQDDPLMNSLDVIGQNEYIGWYEGKPDDADTMQWTLPPKPVLFSEFGAEASSACTEARQIAGLKNSRSMSTNTSSK